MSESNRAAEAALRAASDLAKTMQVDLLALISPFAEDRMTAVRDIAKRIATHFDRDYDAADQRLADLERWRRAIRDAAAWLSPLPDEIADEPDKLLEAVVERRIAEQAASHQKYRVVVEGEFADYERQIATLTAERDALARRVAGLEAVVAKLPKCWRLDDDGKLVQDAPVTPGMLIYSPHHNHPHYKEPAIAGLKSSGDCPIAAYGWGMNVAGHEVANSLEAAAALAAKEVGNGK